MILAVMQPYFFPYFGYFQLIAAADVFVFYDDVTFIKGGWINRNNLLANGKKQLFTLQLQGASSFKKINEISVGNNLGALQKTISQAYSKAPFFDQAFPVIEKVLNQSPDHTIADFSINSVTEVCKYLNIDTRLEISSRQYGSTQDLKKESRLFRICEMNRADTYINSIGGADLYDKTDFRNHHIDLKFIKSHAFEYRQFENEFVSHLSIIDAMMFNSKEALADQLNNYSFE